MTVRWANRPQLRTPVLVAAFEGWNDAGDAASDAVRWLARSFGAREFAALDAEQYFDFQAARPQVELVDGVVRRLAWPSVRFLAAPGGRGRRDLVLCLGIEPNLRWPTFCNDVLAIAHETGCDTAVTLGALLADTPHSRPVRVTGSAIDDETAAQLGIERSRYEGPTGIVGVLHNSFRDAGLTSGSFWAPVPHYVATPPNPKATRALLDRLAAFLRIDIDLTDLDIAAAAWERSVADVVAGDADVTSYVERLETRYDTMEDENDEDDEAADDLFPDVDELDDLDDEDMDDDEFDEDDLPSGDSLAADFERYLREHGEE
jgi:proteasome assembly chaperone (PAC2) family protein